MSGSVTPTTWTWTGVVDAGELCGLLVSDTFPMLASEGGGTKGRTASATGAS
jgi:hypothetical protein